MQTSNRQIAKAGAQKAHTTTDLRRMCYPCLHCLPHHYLSSHIRQNEG